jgi:hypothetical protein
MILAIFNKAKPMHLKKILLLILLIFASSCTTTRTVRQEDLNSWVNVRVIELETHPIFSSMQLEKRKLSDGSELWIYTNQGEPHTRCFTNPFSNQFGYVNCSTAQAVCSNQFLVNQGYVKWYKPIGNCYTDCTLRPNDLPHDFRTHC